MTDRSWRTDRWRESSSIFDAACGILFLPTCAIGGFFHAPRIIWGQQTPFGQDEKPFLDTGERRSEEHTSELQSLMRISYAVFCLKKKTPSTISSQTQKNNT